MAEIDADGFELSSNVPLRPETVGSVAVASGEAPQPEPSPVPEPVPSEPPAPIPDEDRDLRGRFRRGRQRTVSQQTAPEAIAKIAERDTLRKTPSAPSGGAPLPTQQPPDAALSPTPFSASQPSPIPSSFPTFEVWSQGNPQGAYEDYIDARTDFRYQQRRQAEWAQEQHRQFTQTMQQRLTAYQAKVLEAKKAHADFEAVAGRMDLPVSPVMQDAMLRSDHSAEIQYYLGSHPDECLKLAQDTAEATPAAAELMRAYLESRLMAAVPVALPSRTTPTLVPKPPTPVRTGTVTGETPPGDDSSLEDHERYFVRPGRRVRR